MLDVYFHINSMDIVPIYVTSQSAVTARHIVLWEENPASNIADIKQCRDKATKNIGMIIDNR